MVSPYRKLSGGFVQKKNVKVKVLVKLDNRLLNLKRVLLDCFKGIRFTQLKKDAVKQTKQLYDNKVEAYGAEEVAYLDASRNLRKLQSQIKMNTELNKLVVNAICNLARNFIHSS